MVHGLSLTSIGLRQVFNIIIHLKTLTDAIYYSQTKPYNLFDIFDRYVSYSKQLSSTINDSINYDRKIGKKMFWMETITWQFRGPDAIASSNYSSV